MEQRHFRRPGADEKARLEQQRIKGHGFHGHGLAAHIGAGDDRGALIQRDGHRNKGSSLLTEQVHQLRVHHVLQHQLSVGDLGQYAAVTDGKQRLLHHEVQTADGLRVGQQIVHHGGQLRAHGAAHLHLLALLLGADTGALQTQIVLLRVGPGAEQPLLNVLFGGADLLEPRRGAVRDIEAPAAGAVGVQDRQRRGGRVKGHVPEMGGLVDGIQQGQKAVQPLKIALDLKQLHMVGHLAVLAAAQGVADILDLAQDGHQAGIGVLQLIGMPGQRLYVIQLCFQRGTLVRGIEPQAADALQAEGRAAVERLQRVLQADLDFFIK